jgi:hypothetical protein
VDDPDLAALRAFRIDEIEPPAGMQARIEERLWTSIMAEESAGARRSISGARRSWLSSMLRPAVAIGAALSLAIGVAVVSDGGTGSAGIGQSNVRTASTGLFDSTATRLFGADSADAAPVVGTVDLRAPSDEEQVVSGPTHTHDGSLDDATAELASEIPRAPARVSQLVRAGIEASGIDDPSGAAAFRATMRWVVDPAVPIEVRAVMLRSVGELDNVDDAQLGTDVLGRQGVVIGHLDETSGLRTQVVLNASTGTMLELRSYTTTYLDPACPPGTFAEHAAYDEHGDWIDPVRARWADWPIVVASCGSISS